MKYHLKVYPLPIVVGVLLLATIHASPGDRASDFQACLIGCGIKRCLHVAGTCMPVCHEHSSLYQSGVAHWWPWTCAQECRYQCMWQRVQTTGSVEKYYGKWPFVRVLGAQEIAAALLSLANLGAHARGLSMLWRGPTRNVRMRAVYTTQGTIAMASWAAAAAFHTRDVGFTEAVDYFLADAVVFSSLVTTLLRVWGVARPGRVLLIVAAGAALFARHWLYMTRVVFDYGLNMRVCLTLGVVNAAVWLLWAWRTRHPARRGLSTWFGVLFACMALEVFDFSPLCKVVDAHALWHACTVPLTLAWYRLLAVDLAFNEYW